MRKTFFILLSLFALTFAFAALADDAAPARSEAVQTMLGNLDTLGQDFVYLNDADATEECESDADADAGGCGPAVACSCLCNGVPVTVTIYPELHGEKCSDVNGRPCATSETNRGVYKSCA